MDGLVSSLSPFLISVPVWEGCMPSHTRQSYPHLRNEAAVLVLLQLRNGQPFLFLNKRSEHLKNHPGEVCFPGGTRELKDENPQTTALRESYEEVGLASNQVNVLGVVDCMITRTNLILYPVIGELIDALYIPKPNQEVQFSFWLPLRRFLGKENQTIHKFQIGDKIMTTRFFTDRVLSCQGKYEDVVTFGITAWICSLVAMAYFDTCPGHLMVDFGLRNWDRTGNEAKFSDWKSLLKQFYVLQKDTLKQKSIKQKAKAKL